MNLRFVLSVFLGSVAGVTVAWLLNSLIDAV